MRRLTSEQFMTLEAKSLSDWQLIRMSLVCGGINAVPPPDYAGRIQRSFFWFENLGSKDASVLERVILGSVVFAAVLCLGVAISILEITGTPWWGIYIPMGILAIALLAFTYASKIAVLRAGGDMLVVEGYKRRLAEKATERRKHYRPISARKFDV